MTSQRCAIAQNPALGDSARISMHGRCQEKGCDCWCHQATQNVEASLRQEEAPAAERAEPERESRRKPRKRSAGRCEHCGAPTGGRFAPGHDAKLKRDLVADAEGGDVEAWAELVLRDWAKLVPDDKVDRQFRLVGQDIADGEGYRLVEKRVLDRTR